MLIFFKTFFRKNRLDRKGNEYISYKKLLFFYTFRWKSGYLDVSLGIKIK